MFRKILIANDGSRGGERALAAAIKLARSVGAQLDMVCVEELPNFPASIDEVVEDEMDEAHRFAGVIEKATHRAEGVPFKTHILKGHAVSTIVDFIKSDGYDLLVVGFMGHSALYDRIIGSTTDRLVKFAPCKVLVVK